MRVYMDAPLSQWTTMFFQSVICLTVIIKAKNKEAILPPVFFVMRVPPNRKVLYGCGDQSKLVTEMKSVKDQVG